MKQLFPRPRRRWYQTVPTANSCEMCGWPFFINSECSRTMYDWDGRGEDPNRNINLCHICAAAHHQYWDDMWAEVGR